MQGQNQPGQMAPQAARLSPQQLQELVAPIALYPDALVAQILAASAYPTQIVEAQRFMQENSNLKGADLGAAVDKQDWDPSVKALTQFPSVLADMDKNLSWTSTLGDANVNQQSEVMDAVQFMRQKAEQAGNLKTSSAADGTKSGINVVIEPADPQVVYVPDMIRTLFMDIPLDYWPGFYPWWGIGGPYFPSELDSASAHFLDLAGAGTDGDLIGDTEDCSMADIRMRFAATYFTTEMLSRAEIIADSRGPVNAALRTRVDFRSSDNRAEILRTLDPAVLAE